MRSANRLDQMFAMRRVPSPVAPWLKSPGALLRAAWGFSRKMLQIEVSLPGTGTVSIARASLENGHQAENGDSYVVRERCRIYIYICIRVYIYTYLSIVFGFPWHWMTHVRRIRWPFARSLRRCSLCFCSMCTPPQGCGWALERQILWCTSRESGSLCLKLSPMQDPGRSQYHDVVWNDCFFGWTLLKIFSRLSFLKMHSLKRMDMLLHMGLCETKVHQNWMVCHQSSLKSPFWGIPNFQTYWTSSRLQECCASKRGPWMSLVPWLSQQLIWSWI